MGVSGKAARFFWAFFLSFLLVFAFSVFDRGFCEESKHELMSNMQVKYNELPGDAQDITAMFRQGIFYGRLRTNLFGWDWESEAAGKRKDNWAFGIGGSLVYKSAYLNGFGVTAGLYASESPWRMDDKDVGYIKAGKDVLSRYEVATEGSHSMAVLAQAYLEYKTSHTRTRVGRQLFESLLTGSNDTKMIPNAFEGLSFETDLLANTAVKAAFLTRQKLRDHTTFHHVLAYGDDPSDPFAKWSENDDSAMHKGLKLSRLKAAGIDDRLAVVEAKSSVLENITFMANLTAVPELLWSAAAEVNCAFMAPGGFKIVPGVRFLRQFDRKAGQIGGASLSGNITAADDRGYDRPYDLDGRLLAARVRISKGAARLSFGWSTVADRADLVAPWRGFPTAGYTRAMGQYNWYAGTRTFMAEALFDFGKAGLASGLSANLRYAVENFDDAKPDVPADMNVATLDLVQKVSPVPGLWLKARFAVGRGEGDAVDMNGALKSDPSYAEGRLEANYLF